MIYDWLVTLIGYVNQSSQYGQNSTIIQLSGLVVVLLLVVTVDLIYSLIYNLTRGRKR